MKFKTLTLGHIRLISLYWSRYAVRSGSGLVYLLIALIFGLFVAHILIMPVEQLMAEQQRRTGQTDPHAIRNAIIDIGRPIIQLVLGKKSFKQIVQEASEQQPGFGPYQDGNPIPLDAGNTAARFDPWTSFLLEKRPALLSAILLVLLFGMPFVISFLAFNQVSGDIQNHGLRYLLLRTERASIYFGRFLGTVVFSTVVMAIIIVTIVFYLGMKTRIYPALDLAGWAAHGFLALAILMVPYIAVCSLISASVDSPFVSLILAKLTIAGVLLAGALGGLAWKPAKYVTYALPWGWQSNLLHPAPSHWLAAGLACFLYTGLFLVLGYYRFEGRDL
ncbi:MAG: ABC transporter permease [Planctomycetota bacterium]|jgi:ABC-type transport system involved in multi-copper enzyme maturation permease subunit